MSMRALFRRVHAGAKGLPVPILAALSLPVGLVAQSTPDLWVLRSTDGVVVQVPVIPPGAAAFHVERDAGAGFERLTEAPVEATRDPSEVSIALGSLLPLVQDRTRSLTEAATIRLVLRRDVVADLLGWTVPEVAAIQGRRFVDTEAPEGEPTYRVVFVDAGGDQISAVAENATAGPVGPGMPGAPTVETASREVALRWTYSPYTGSPSDVVVGYHVYRSGAAEAELVRRTELPVARDDSAAVAWRDLEVENGVAYRYVVRAVDVLGREGPSSPEVIATPSDPDPPTAPRSLRTFPGEGSVTLLWRLSPESDLAGYRIERSGGLDQEWDTLTANLSPQDPSWIDSTAVGGRQLFYRVVAVDSAGRESTPSNPVGETALDTRPPMAPTDLVLTLEGRVAVAAWTGPDEAQLAGYHVYRSDEAGTLARLTSEPTTETEWRDGGPGGSGLTPGARYTVRVTAVDSAGNESAAVTAEVGIPDDVAPGAPSSLAVEPSTGTAAEVRWNAAPGRDVALYRLERVSAGGAEPEVIDSIRSSRPRLVRTEALSAGIAYTFLLTAVDSAGNEGPPASVTFTAGDRTPPPAPGFVQARAAEGGVVVAWERVVADDLSGYLVQRADLPTGSFEEVSVLLPADAERRWVDTSGTAGSWYRVVAVDTSGNRSNASVPARAEGVR